MRLQTFFAFLLIALVCSAQDGLLNFQEKVLNKINTLTEGFETLKTEVETLITVVETLKTCQGMYMMNSFSYYCLISL